MYFILQRAPVGESPRHPTVEYALVEVATGGFAAALGRFTAHAGQAVSVSCEPLLSAATADDAADLVRGAQGRAAFLARADVIVLPEGV